MPLTYLTVPGNGLWIPRPVAWGLSGPGFTSGIAHTATNDAQHYILRVPKTGTLKGFGCRINAVATPNTVRAGFQNVSLSTGLGDTTFDEFVDIASGSLPTGWFDTSTIGPITSDGTGGGTKRSVTKGDLLAAVLIPTATPISFRTEHLGNDDTGAGMTNFPYSKENFSGSFNAIAPFALLYDDDTWGAMPDPPVDVFHQSTFNSGDNPDERALRFSLPFNYKITGFYFKANISNDADYVLYDSDGSTVIETISVDPDVRRTTSGSGGFYGYWNFTDSIELSADTFYRIALKPGGSNVTYYDFDVPSADLMDTQDGGQDFHESHRVNAGSWTDVTTRRPWAGIVIDQIETGVSLGAAVEHSHVFIGGVV